MKNLSGILNVVLVAAVAVLFYLVLGTKTSNETSTPMEVSLPSEEGKALSVAYINMDTLQVYYNYYKELMEEFQAEAKQAEQVLIRKQQGFQESVALFEEKAPQMSPQEFERYRADLEQTRNKIVGEQQQMEQALMQKEQVLLMELKQEVDSALAEIKDEKQLDFVFTYPLGSGLLYANEGYDITAMVSERLNAMRPTETVE